MPELNDIFSQTRWEYEDRFGRLDVTLVGISAEDKGKLLTEMKRALAGKRGQVSEDDLESSIPPEALI